MDRLETLLHEVLTEHAERAPSGPVRLDAPVHRARTGLAVGFGVAAAVAATIVTVLVARSGNHDQAPVTGATGSALSAAPLPTSQQLVAYGQVSLRVPKTLATRSLSCGNDIADSVVAMTPADGQFCPKTTGHLASHPGTVVWFTSSGQSTPYSEITATSTTIDGHPARRGYAEHAPNLGSGTSALVSFPEFGISVGVTAPTRQQVDQLISTIRVTIINSEGCAANYAKAPKTGSLSDTTLVSPGVTSAVRCKYDNGTGLLVATNEYSDTSLKELTEALNALKPDPCHCVHGGTPAPGHAEIVYLHYPDGTVERLTGQIGANLDTWTNGAYTVANYSSSIVALLDRLANR